jgi:protein-disulfide reductase (glutathione)
MCKALKPVFHDPTLAALSKRFVMVNVDVDNNTVSQRPPYTPDGTYVPRVLFVDPQTGNVDVALRNEERGKDRYFYTRNDDLLAVMKKALTRYERT